MSTFFECVYTRIPLACFATHFPARALARVLFSDAHVSLVMSLVLFLHACLMLRKCVVLRRFQRSLNVCAAPADVITLVFDTSSSAAKSSPGHYMENLLPNCLCLVILWSCLKRACQQRSEVETFWIPEHFNNDDALWLKVSKHQNTTAATAGVT